MNDTIHVLNSERYCCSCVAIHNFLRKIIVIDFFFEQFEHEVVLQENQQTDTENWLMVEVTG